ncbi:hypothetical protein ACHAPJ_009392 [Fusarium lateritium]
MRDTPYLSNYSNRYSVAGGATRVGIGGSRANDHLGRALAEVDGLFAGFIYLDKTEPESSSTQTRQPKVHRTGCSDDLSLELDALCSQVPLTTASDSEPRNFDTNTCAREIAWASIRTVRDGMQALWEHFVDVAQDLDLPTINNIRADYQDAKGLRQTGVVAFRNTLTGPSPNDLAKIFAFCSLSYVVSRLLYTRGRLAKGDVLAGIRLWLDALEDEDERKAFKILAKRLWPEAQNHLHFVDFDLGERSQRLATALRRGETPFSPSPTHTCPTSLPAGNFGSEPLADYDQQTHIPFQEHANATNLALPSELESIDPSLLNQYARQVSPVYAQNLVDLTSEELNFSFGSGLLPTLGSQIAPWSWPDPGPDHQLDFDASMMGLATPGFVAKQSIMRDTPTINPTHEPDTISPPTTPDSAGDIERLQGTFLFKAVVQYFRESGPFWHQLAGHGLVSRDLRSCLAWGQERLTKKRKIQTSYIDLLSSAKSARNLPSQGIVSIAETFVERGLLQTVADIEYYMEWIGIFLFDDHAARREFRDWIRGFQESLQPSMTPSKRTKSKEFVNTILVGLDP